LDTMPNIQSNSALNTKDHIARQALYVLYQRELSYTRMFMAPLAKDPDTDDGLSLVLIGPALDTVERYRFEQHLDTRSLITLLTRHSSQQRALLPELQSAISTLDFNYGRVHQATVMRFLNAR